MMNFHDLESNEDRGWFDNQTESITTNDAHLLSLAISNKTYFVLLNNTIKVLFMRKNPHTTNNINISKTRHQLPRLILISTSYFSNMVALQLEYIQGCKRVTRKRRLCSMSMEIKKSFRLHNPILKTDNHMRMWWNRRLDHMPERWRVRNRRRARVELKCKWACKGGERIIGRTHHMLGSRVGVQGLDWIRDWRIELNHRRKVSLGAHLGVRVGLNRPIITSGLCCPVGERDLERV